MAAAGLLTLTLTCGAEGLILVRGVGRFKSGAVPAFRVRDRSGIDGERGRQLERIARPAAKAGNVRLCFLEDIPDSSPARLRLRKRMSCET